MKKHKTIILSILGTISAFLGIIGISGFCCTILGGVILSGLGIASFSLYFVYYSEWFLLAAFVLLLFAGASHWEYRNNKTCPAKINKKVK